MDAEILEMLATLLDRVGISGWELQLNSVGCANCRPKYLAALQEALSGVVKNMCADCQRRAETNPLRVFDCKVSEDQPIIEKLPRMSDYLDESCRTQFQAVQDILRSLEVPFVLNSRLVRGLDYYTRTAFEFTHGALGAQNAILGGGRYDGLSENLGGPPADVIVELGNESFRLKKSLETASKIGARFALIVGENEIKANEFALKNLATGEQITVPRADLATKIQSVRG